MLHLSVAFLFLLFLSQIASHNLRTKLSDKNYFLKRLKDTFGDLTETKKFTDINSCIAPKMTQIEKAEMMGTNIYKEAIAKGSEEVKNDWQKVVTKCFMDKSPKIIIYMDEITMMFTELLMQEKPGDDTHTYADRLKKPIRLRNLIDFAKRVKAMENKMEDDEDTKIEWKKISSACPLKKLIDEFVEEMLVYNTKIEEASK